MRGPRKPAGLGGALYILGLISAGTYFTFAAVQGDYGLFHRARVDAEVRALVRERDRLAAEIATMENRTRRMSDEYLDLDLLDEQARDVLGLVRADEIVLR